MSLPARSPAGAFLGAIFIVVSAALAAAACKAAPAASSAAPAATAAPAGSVPPTATAVAVLPSATPPLPTPTATAVPWLDQPLIDQTQPVVLTNTTPLTRGRMIYASQIILSSDTRWLIDVQVDRLAPDTSDTGTGLLLQSLGPGGVQSTLALVYHSGLWALGYRSASQGGGAIYWRDFKNMQAPAQQFELTVSPGGRTVSLKSGQGFQFDWTPVTPLFNPADPIVVSAQIGPHSQIRLSGLDIQQRPTSPAENASEIAPTLPAGQAANKFDVAPNGRDDNPGTASQPFATLQRARDAVRALTARMPGPITVTIHSGVYPVSQTILFGPEDSGQNGFEVIYRAAAGETPVFSGGLTVSGWQAMPGSPIWRAILPPVQPFRQLYVNGARAGRAGLASPLTGLSWAKGDTSARDGIVMARGALPAFARPQDLELHWIVDWKDMRLPVRTITQNSDGTETIWMRQPYYSYALSMGPLTDVNQGWMPRYTAPFYVENALELLTQPGQWYYNADSHELFYWPLPQQDMTTAAVVVPQTQQLLSIAGRQAGQEVHDLAFEGLTFAYAGWTRASAIGTFGPQDQELITDPNLGLLGYDMTPASLQLTFARAIRLQASRFEHLGAAAVYLGEGATDDVLRGNLFYDISDAAVVAGHWNDAYITAPVQQVAPHHDLIVDNLIDSTGAEYWGAPAITAYYVADLQVLHNEISNVPYSGISLGWGWSSTTDSTTSHGNQVANNLIQNVTQRARDGGGIYTLGPQPETVVAGNVIRRVSGDYACLYPDEGSTGITFQNNVCDSAPLWLFIWTSSIHSLQVLNSYTNVANLTNAGQAITIQNTVAVTGQSWPAEAQAIMAQAGLEPDYAYLRTWLAQPVGSP